VFYYLHLLFIICLLAQFVYYFLFFFTFVVRTPVDIVDWVVHEANNYHKGSGTTFVQILETAQDIATSFNDQSGTIDDIPRYVMIINKHNKACLKCQQTH